MSLHLELADWLNTEFAQHLAAPPELRQDALRVALANGVQLEIRYAAADAYSLRWRVGDLEFGIDTAPTHAALDTHPNHLHTASGAVVADPLTRCGAPPEQNLRAVLDALLEDPRLANALSFP